MDLILKILIVAAIVFFCWLVLQPRYLFVIDIRDGQVKRSRGVVPPGFMEDVERICRDSHLVSGSIRAVARGKRTSLSFSRHIPSPVCQKLRNAWCLCR